MPRPRPRPRLLVSVRNLAEARAAIDGGCDRLDVKEPDRGPLGRADADVIAEIAAFAQNATGRGTRVSCSVALGEIDESRDATEPFVLPPGVSDIKLGPARLPSRDRWTQGWRRVVERVQGEEERAMCRVAVAYADWQAAGAAVPEQILNAAIEAGADAFLVDTYSKQSGNLLEALALDDLKRLVRQAREAGLTVALAGSLRLEHLPALVDVHPDVIAVRGAACESGRRAAHVSPACVGRLKAAIDELF
jgi:(5-formylfuran-3-yl)methyl phosphate synthase